MAKDKHWYMQLDIDDWENDPALCKCSKTTRGIWSLIICRMHRNDRSGILEGTIEELALLTRTKEEEFVKAIEELKATETADILLHCNANVTGSNTKVTLVNRRMNREYKSRKGTALRVSKHREKQPCNEIVTPHIYNYSYNHNQIKEEKQTPELADIELPQRHEKTEPVRDSEIAMKAIQHVQTNWGIAEMDAGRINNVKIPGSWQRREDRNGKEQNCIQRTVEEKGLDFVLQIEPWVFNAARKHGEKKSLSFGWGTVVYYLESPEFYAEKEKRQQMKSQEAAKIDKKEVETIDYMPIFENLPQEEQEIWLRKAREGPFKPKPEVAKKIAAGYWWQARPPEFKAETGRRGEKMG
ncbi:MAG: hypothetical protein WDK95_10645 [Syntrophorhabdaceae bacterium]